jgi:ATP-dependent RNA helicase DDX24/MAK5
LEHQINKEKNNTSWYEKNAKQMDIELDDELIKETRVDNAETRKNKINLNKFKQELEKQLKKMILPKNVSRNYLRQDSFNRILSMNSKLIFIFILVFI